jgi:hypothetical protein
MGALAFIHASSVCLSNRTAAYVVSRCYVTTRIPGPGDLTASELTVFEPEMSDVRHSDLSSAFMRTLYAPLPSGTGYRKPLC